MRADQELPTLERVPTGGTWHVPGCEQSVTFKKEKKQKVPRKNTLRRVTFVNIEGLNLRNVLV